MSHRCKVWIVAGNLMQARDWAHEFGLTWDYCVYLDTPDRLRGPQNIPIVWIGTWSDRPDAQEFVENARFCDRLGPS